VCPESVDFSITVDYVRETDVVINNFLLQMGIDRLAISRPLYPDSHLSTYCNVFIARSPGYYLGIKINSGSVLPRSLRLFTYTKLVPTRTIGDGQVNR
jgi:hypothetical protein